MNPSTEEFLHIQNVTKYTRLLRDAPDEEVSRKMLMDLLAEEAAKARAADWMPMLG